MFKAVIFDFGGVVHSLGGKKLSEILADKTGLSKDEVLTKIKPKLLEMSIGKIDEELFWRSFGVKIEGVWDEQLKDNRLNYQVVELVKNLRSKNIITLVLSNTIPPHSKIIKDLGWYGYFDKIYLSHDIRSRKPDIKAYEYVLKDQNLNGNECIFVDDLEENLIPAKNLGMKTILARNPIQVVNEIKQELS